MKKQSVKILNDADDFSRQLDWILFKTEQDNRLFNGPSNQWRPGDNLFPVPGRVTPQILDCAMAGYTIWAIIGGPVVGGFEVYESDFDDHEDWADNYYVYEGNVWRYMADVIELESDNMEPTMACPDCLVSWDGMRTLEDLNCWVCGKESKFKRKQYEQFRRQERLSMARQEIMKRRERELTISFQIDSERFTRSMNQMAAAMNMTAEAIREMAFQYLRGNLRIQSDGDLLGNRIVQDVETFELRPVIHEMWQGLVEVEPYYPPGHTLPRLLAGETEFVLEIPALIDIVFGGGTPAVDRNYAYIEFEARPLPLPTNRDAWERLNPPATQQRRRRRE